MKIGVQTGGILDRFGLDEGFRIIKEAGFDCVDFNIDHGMAYKSIVNGVCESDFDKSYDEIAESLRPCKEAAAKYGISFYQAHAPFPFYVKDYPDMNEYLYTVMEKSAFACSQVGCRYLIIHPSFCPYKDKLDYDDEWNINIERYSRLIPALKKYNVIACLENMFTSRDGKIYEAICSDMNEAAAYIDELNEIAHEKRFAFCFDTGHALLVGKDIKSALMAIGDRVEAFHVHDNDGINDQHVSPYTGRLDWQRFIEGVKAIKYDRAMCFETFNTTNKYPKELIPDALKLIARTGRYFAEKISE